MSILGDLGLGVRVALESNVLEQYRRRFRSAMWHRGTVFHSMLPVAARCTVRHGCGCFSRLGGPRLVDSSWLGVSASSRLNVRMDLVFSRFDGMRLEVEWTVNHENEWHSGLEVTPN